MDLFRRKELMDPSEIEALAGLRPLFDPVFNHLLEGAYKGVVDVYFAAVPFGLIQPFDPDYDPGKHPVGRAAIAEFVARWERGEILQSWVYQKGDQFVLSDDYIIWEAAKVGQPDFLPCWILGKPSSSGIADLQGPIDPSELRALLGFSGGPSAERITTEFIDLRPVQFPLADEAAFWRKYPQQPEIFRAFVVNPGIHLSVGPDSATKRTIAEHPQRDVENKEINWDANLPVPPTGYFWAGNTGGLIQAGWRYFRLWGHDLGYMPGAE